MGEDITEWIDDTDTEDDTETEDDSEEGWKKWMNL